MRQTNSQMSSDKNAKLVGLFLLTLIIFTFPQLFNLFWGFKRVDKTFNLLLLISILSFCMVENILERQIGVYLYALILSWSIKKKNKVIC